MKILKLGIKSLILGIIILGQCIIIQQNSIIGMKVEYLELITESTLKMKVKCLSKGGKKSGYRTLKDLKSTNRI